jgi:hypothetical protein
VGSAASVRSTNASLRCRATSIAVGGPERPAADKGIQQATLIPSMDPNQVDARMSDRTPGPKNGKRPIRSPNNALAHVSKATFNATR